MAGMVLLLAAALLCSAAALVAANSYTYTYVGPKFTVGTDHLEVSFTTSAPLAPSKSYLAKVDASVVAGSIKVMGPNGLVSGLNLALTTFQVHTDATASASTHGIDSWFMMGDFTAVTGTTRVNYQAYTMNSMLFIPGSDIPGAIGLITGHYNYDQATIISFYPSCTGIPGCQVGGSGQAYVGNYSAIINPANSNPSFWKLTSSTSTVVITGSLPTATVNSAYSSSGLSATGGVAPYTWSAASLPGGLSIDPATGLVSGTPLSSGSFGVTVTAVDSTGAVGVLSLTLLVKAPLALSGSLPNGIVNTAYSSSGVTASGGTSPYTWSASGLPAGLTMSASGLVSGTPTALGTYSVNVMVTDSTGATLSQVYSVTITVAPIVISGTLPGGTQNVAYSSSALSATGGTGSRSWSASGLPAGLNIAPGTGVVSGTPSVTGSFPVTITVTDSATPTPALATKSMTLTIAAPIALTISGTLPGGTVTVAYSSSGMSATGGSVPYTWSASGLPAGLTIAAATGVVSGTPTTPATYSATINVKDAAGTLKSLTVSIVVKAALGLTGTLSAATVGTFYNSSGKLTATGGWTAYTWSATGLPTGLSIASATGTITGTFTAAGTYPVTVTVTDSKGNTKSTTQSIAVTVAALAISGTLPGGTKGVAYSSSALSSTGGTGTKTWSATGLPAGLTIAAATGIVSGTPTTVATYTVTVTLKDGAGTTKTKSHGTQDVYYSAMLSATGGDGSYTWEAAGLPMDLFIDAATGEVYGTPIESGPFTVTVTVTDGTGASASLTDSLIIDAPPVEYSCTEPPNSDILEAKSPISEVGAGYIVVGGVTLQTPSCTVIHWNNYQTAFAVGQMADYKAWTDGTVNVVMDITID
eukprot:jgi/Mesvir1/17587/Mv08820-RA.1